MHTSRFPKDIFVRPNTKGVYDTIKYHEEMTDRFTYFVRLLNKSGRNIEAFYTDVRYEDIYDKVMDCQDVYSSYIFNLEWVKDRWDTDWYSKTVLTKIKEVRTRYALPITKRPNHYTFALAKETLGDDTVEMYYSRREESGSYYSLIYYTSEITGVYMSITYPTKTITIQENQGIYATIKLGNKVITYDDLETLKNDYDPRELHVFLTKLYRRDNKGFYEELHPVFIRYLGIDFEADYYKR